LSELKGDGLTKRKAIEKGIDEKGIDEKGIDETGIDRDTTR
jgi:hypothetical protein